MGLDGFRKAQMRRTTDAAGLLNPKTLQLVLELSFYTRYSVHVFVFI
jgi:hypothetical protein